jgi:hypothetical protein
MHISLQLKTEREKLIKKQNTALVLGIWCFKLYMMFFASLIILTKSDNSRQIEISLVSRK